MIIGHTKFGLRSCIMPVQNCTMAFSVRIVGHCMQWNWDHIRFVLALAEQGTLSDAARVLGVSHSTVLRRIRQLEKDIDAQLFDHTNNGYALTPSGNTLYNEAKKMRSTMSALSREISGADNRMVGKVAITTTDTIARHILPKLLAELTKKYPALEFTVHMANAMSDMDNRDADIAIRSCKRPPDNLIGRHVATLEFAAIASKAYVKTHKLTNFPVNSDGHRFIVLDDSYSSAPFYQWLRNNIGKNAHLTTASNFLCATALASEGMGITVVPTYLLNTESRLVELKTSEEISRNDLWVLSHSDSRNTEKVRVVRQYFYEALGARFSGA